MSTPFPLEEQSQTQGYRPTWNPWDKPAEPHWYSGMGFTEDTAYTGPLYRLAEGLGSGAAKGEQLLGGMLHSDHAVDYSVDDQGGLVATQGRAIGEKEGLNPLADAIQTDARARVKAMTPDASQMGAAVNLIHGVASGGEQMLVGGLAGGPLGAAVTVGGGEAYERYLELREQGVDEATASKAALITGGFSGAGALLPGGVGESLLSKMVTGAAGNTLFGLANRYADHQVLDSAGYHEMADQEKVWDSGQVLADLILGTGFGALAHLHDPARALTVGNADRDTAPGIPVDPESAALHQAALEKAQEDLLQGKKVDVAETGVDQGRFVGRPEARGAEAEEMVRAAADFDDDAALRELDESMAGRTPKAERPPGPSGREFPEEGEEGAPNKKEPTDATEQILKDKPNLMITDEDGNRVKAADAIQAANDEVARQTSDNRKAVAAAVNCYLRRGS